MLLFWLSVDAEIRYALALFLSSQNYSSQLSEEKNNTINHYNHNIITINQVYSDYIIYNLQQTVQTAAVFKINLAIRFENSARSVFHASLILYFDHMRQDCK